MKHELIKYLIVITIFLHPLATLYFGRLIITKILYFGWLIITKILYFGRLIITKIELETRAPNLFGFLLGIVFYAIVKNLIENDYLRAFFKGLFLK